MVLKTTKIILLCLLAMITLSCSNKKWKEESEETQKIQEVQESQEVQQTQENQENQEVQEKKEKKEKKEIEMYRISYNNSINDYKVTVDWYPHTGASKNSVLGKGEIHFVHTSGAQFKIVHKNFYLVDLIPLDWESDKLYLPSKKEITLDYIQYVDTSEFINTNLPFLFYDTNFDGKDELVLIHPAAAQRTRDYLAVYYINDNYTVDNLPNHNTHLGSDYAFDSYTKFNKKEKTITVFDSGGALYYEERIYKYNTKTNKLEVEEVNGRDGSSTYTLKKPFSIPQDSIDMLYKNETSYWENWY